MKTPRTALGRIGIWSGELRFGERSAAREAAAELDALGFGAVWIPGGVGGDLFADVDGLLAATRRTVIATGILNIWKHEPAAVAAWWKSRAPDHRSRLMLGLGVSHGPLIGEAYGRPLSAMNAYLARLDANGVPEQVRCLAALAPKMLELAGRRSAGSHPYLTTPEHTAWARQVMGPQALLAPEQGVVLEAEPGRARELARAGVASYLRLPNYVNAWLRLGFSESEITGLSDRLIDHVFAWGGLEAVRRRVQAHLDAGADHVCLQVIRGPLGAGKAPPMEAWRELAGLL